MSKLTLWNQCQKVASILDDEIEEWYKQIELGIIEMVDCNYCILGQLYHSYWSYDAKEIRDKIKKLGFSEALGINVHLEGEQNVKKLNDYWKTLIMQRRKRNNKTITYK